MKLWCRNQPLYWKRTQKEDYSERRGRDKTMTNVYGCEKTAFKSLYFKLSFPKVLGVFVQIENVFV